jgi:hypothetical protein
LLENGGGTFVDGIMEWKILIETEGGQEGEMDLIVHSGGKSYM